MSRGLILPTVFPCPDPAPSTTILFSVIYIASFLQNSSWGVAVTLFAWAWQLTAVASAMEKFPTFVYDISLSLRITKWCLWYNPWFWQHPSCHHILHLVCLSKEHPQQSPLILLSLYALFQHLLQSAVDFPCIALWLCESPQSTSAAAQLAWW